jgi:hypothetical protein
MYTDLKKKSSSSQKHSCAKIGGPTGRIGADPSHAVCVTGASRTGRVGVVISPVYGSQYITYQ